MLSKTLIAALIVASAAVSFATKASAGPGAQPTPANESYYIRPRVAEPRQRWQLSAADASRPERHGRRVVRASRRSIISFQEMSGD